MILHYCLLGMVPAAIFGSLVNSKTSLDGPKWKRNNPRWCLIHGSLVHQNCGSTSVEGHTEPCLKASCQNEGASSGNNDCTILELCSNFRDGCCSCCCLVLFSPVFFSSFQNTCFLVANVDRDQGVRFEDGSSLSLGEQLRRRTKPQVRVPSFFAVNPAKSAQGQVGQLGRFCFPTIPRLFPRRDLRKSFLLLKEGETKK